MFLGPGEGRARGAHDSAHWPAAEEKNGGGIMRRIVKRLVPFILLTVATSTAAGAQNNADTVDNLLKDLKSSDYEKAWGAAQSLSRFPQHRPQIVPALINALLSEWSHCSGDIREAIGYSLAELKAKEAAFPLLALVRSGKSIEHECAECGCCFNALTPGDEIAGRGFDPFCANSVLGAINQLADFSHTKAMADLVSEGKSKPELISTIGKVGLPRYAYFISRYKDDKDVAVRRAVAFALGLMKNEDITVPVLLQLLSRSDEDFSVRWEASNSLVKLAQNKPAASLESRLANLLNERDRMTVLLTARALALLRLEKGAAKLRALATDEDAEVRSEAVMSLGEASDSGSRALLIERLQDESLKVRGAAIFALGQSGDRSVIPILQEAFERSNAYQEELQGKRKRGGSEDEKMLREKYGLGAFDLRQTLQEAIDTVQRKADKTKRPGN